MFALRVLGLSLFSLAVSFAGANRMLARMSGYFPVAVPNGRSSHAVPTVTAGGTGLALAILIIISLIGMFDRGPSRVSMILFAITTGFVSALGLWDDFRNPATHWRLILQVTIALLVIVGGVVFQMPELPLGRIIARTWAMLPITLLWITGLINLFNFIDGADGLALSLAMVYCAGITVAAFLSARPQEAIIALTVIAGCLGLLWYNFPPARLFMGGVGSLTLGFVISVLAIRLTGRGTRPIPFMFFVILYSSFMFDTTYTVLRRVLKGERFWVAHRTHLYEKLLQAGWSHLRVVSLYLVMALVSLCLALLYLHARSMGRTSILMLQTSFCIAHLALVKRVQRQWSQHTQELIGATRSRCEVLSQ